MIVLKMGNLVKIIGLNLGQHPGCGVISEVWKLHWKQDKGYRNSL
jgi:hypothetical protein